MTECAENAGCSTKQRGDSSACINGYEAVNNTAIRLTTR